LRAAILGGSLQGVEAAYLAHKAGWEVLLLDKNPNPPAVGLCDQFIQMDITATGKFEAILRDIDIIIPATENLLALKNLMKWSREIKIPTAFDMAPFTITSSKQKSNRLFTELGLPVPLTWPNCRFPVIAKPNTGSGSQGVKLIQNRQQLEKVFNSVPSSGWVVQEYLEGPSVSLEILGIPGNYQVLQVTDLEMDENYDCKRVIAPSTLKPDLVAEFEQTTLKIANAIALKGLMDVEAILHRGKLKILEIDARLPSQTPTAVYWSTGINMLEQLVRYFMDEKESHRGHSEHREELPDSSIEGAQIPNKDINPGIVPKGIVYEHIRVSPGTIKFCGEHIMTQGGTLHLKIDFFGADEAITDYTLNKKNWIATLIITGNTRSEALKKHKQVIKNIRKHIDNQQKEIFK